MKRISVLVLVFWCLHSSSFAWSRTGHMLIASWAYWELSSEDRLHWVQVLASHPDYTKWSEDYDQINTTGIDRGEYLFMRASLWPDEIRRNTGSEFNHPAWHYINYPIKAPDFPEEAGWNPEDNIVYGLGRIRDTLTTSSTDDVKRAAYFSWVLHLIGDLHQPMHSSALVNDVYPKADGGDRGGNSFYVKPRNRTISLHYFWDGLLGTAHSPRRAITRRARLRPRFGRRSLSELQESTDVAAWTRESWRVAVDIGYLRGALDGSASRDSGPFLPAGYAARAQAAAERRAALASYRMADWIASLR